VNYKEDGHADGDAKAERGSHCRFEKSKAIPSSSLVVRTIFWCLQIEKLGRCPDKEASNNGPEQKADEIFVILQAHTISCPRAMMIHSHHTLTANATMMRSRWFYIFTFVAVLKR